MAKTDTAEDISTLVATIDEALHKLPPKERRKAIVALFRLREAARNSDGYTNTRSA